MSCLFTYMAYLFVINSISCSRTIIILLYQKRFMAYANSKGSREPAHPQLSLNLLNSLENDKMFGTASHIVILLKPAK